MGKSTFQGYVRTYGGQDRSSGVTPGTLVASEVITFLSSTATATAVSVGATVNANAPFVLPAGAIPLSFAVLSTSAGGATTTVNLGSAANSTGIANNLVTGARAVVALTGALVVASGLTANTTVVGSVGSTAGTGNVTGVFTYTFADGTAQPGEIGPA
jgi:predicted hotdog family 3-hydroxylacyl-ACP dehydratase